MGSSSSYWEASGDLAGRDPRLHVVNSFRDLELSVVLARERLSGTKYENTEQIIAALREQQQVKPDAAALYLKLKQMRDEVAAGRVTPTIEEARRYAKLVDDLLPHIRANG